MNKEDLREKFLNAPEPAWVREMKEHYSRTGYYRPRDLQRVLGDPRAGDRFPKANGDTENKGQ